MTQRDHDLLMGHEVLFAVLLRYLRDDLRSAVVAVLFLELFYVLPDEEVDLAWVCEQIFQLGDELDEFLVLLLNLLTLQAGETPELHVEHGLRLDLRQVERPGHQGVLRLLGGLGASDRLDHLVQLVQRLDQALEDVVAIARLAEVELGSAANHVLAERDVLLQRRLQVDHPGLAVDECEHVHGERAAHRCVLVERVQYRPRLASAAQFNDDAHAVAVRLVSQVANAVDLFVPHEVGDTLHQRRFIDLERQLRHDNLHLVTAGGLLDMRPRLHDDASAAVVIDLLDGVTQDVLLVTVRVVLAFAPHAIDDAAGREVRAFDDLG